MNEHLNRRLKELIIKETHLEGVTPNDIKDDAPLFGEGLGLDSIDALELVVAVEREFRIKISDEEVGMKAFKSINSLSEFITMKGAGG